MPGLVVGLIVSVASTMVLSRLLIDRNELQSPHGKVMIGITLVEDLAVVVLTILMPVLVSLNPHHLLGVGKALGKAALILAPIGLLAAYLVPRVLRRVARANNNELFLLVLLAVCLGTAALTEAVGLSLALGSVRRRIDRQRLGLCAPRTRPTAALARRFRRAVLRHHRNPDQSSRRALVSADPDRHPSVGGRGQVLHLGRYRQTVSIPIGRTAVLVGTGLTQIGEFSFILVQVAHSNGLARRPLLLLDAGRVSDFHPRKCRPGSLGASLDRRSQSRITTLAPPRVFPLKRLAAVPKLGLLLRFSLPPPSFLTAEFCAFAAIQVQYSVVSTDETQNIGLSNLTPAGFTSKVALVPAFGISVAHFAALAGFEDGERLG